MRISDWSSDVCSSDLLRNLVDEAPVPFVLLDIGQPLAADHDAAEERVPLGLQHHVEPLDVVEIVRLLVLHLGAIDEEDRSEERRVGKECVSTCRSRWSPDN